MASVSAPRGSTCLARTQSVVMHTMHASLGQGKQTAVAGCKAVHSMNVGTGSLTPESDHAMMASVGANR